MITFKHQDIQTIIEFNKNTFNNLTLENNRFFVDTIEQLLSFLKNEDSKIVIYDNKEPFKLEYLDFIYNYIDLNYENKKINQLLNKNIIKSINESPLRLNELLNDSFQYISAMTDDFISGVSLSIPETTNFVKIFNLKVEIKGDSLLEKIINYIDVLVEFTNIKVLILLSAKEFFDKSEILKLWYHCQYREVSLLNMQFWNPYKIDNEKNLIIDNDLCEILE